MILCTLALIASASAKSIPVVRDTGTRTHIADAHPNLIQTSSSSSAHFKAAVTDTYYLYGGPGSVLGKFQTHLNPRHPGNPDAQGWFGVDATDQPPHWQRSDFRSPTGTQAMWAGRDASQEPGWEGGAGYGNSWDAYILYRKPLSIPTQGQTVELSFRLHHDVEPGFDFFFVEYDSANVTINVLTRTGRTEDPVQVPEEVTNWHPIVYSGGDYGLDDHITIRMRAFSDVAWSDEDGLYLSEGHSQVDDILVTSSEGSDFEDFEGPGPYLWQPVKAPFAGLFTKLYQRVMDIDPCRENTTPLLCFIDDGTPASNAGGILWNGEPIPSIGTTSQTYGYAVPGGWVVNYNGGVSFGQLSLDNEWWSPEVEWDLPSGADDGDDVAGAFLRYSVYRHGLITTGMFYQWQVRGRSASTGLWSRWTDRGFVYFVGFRDWLNAQSPVSDLIPPDRDRVQALLACRDVAAFYGFPGTDASVAPLYDNVAFAKYRIGGPTLATREIDLFGDSFAGSGLADVSTQAARDLLDCRVDMNRSVSPASVPIRSGDSLMVDVTSVIPGVGITDPVDQITLHYSLNLNPFFEAEIRPNAPTTSLGTGLYGWDESEGSVPAAQSTTTAGVPVANRYYFDLPDENFMYPGDVLEYHLEAVDDDGRTSTLPANLSGYDDGPNGAPYNRVYQIRGLPSYSAADGSHPELLFWNDFANRGGDEEILSALRQNGMLEGVHFDTYSTRGPSSLVDNGLGSWSPNGRGHGAKLAQVSGYRALVYEAGDLSSGLISNGSDAGLNDKGNDVGLLRSWFDTADTDRFIAHFGDNIAAYLGLIGPVGAASATQLAYLSQVMGVTVSSTDVRPTIGNQTAPRVLPTGAMPSFGSNFIAFGGCLAINWFDNIDAAPGAVRGHGFEVLGAPGTTYAAPGRAASVVWDRMVGSARKASVTFPFGMMYVHPLLGEQPSGLPILLGELLNLFEHTSGPPTASDLPRRSLELLAPAPNPFNPRTTLQFVLGRDASGDIEIFDLRGRNVRSLARNASFDAGAQQLVWDGRDDAGAEIASGVYLVRYRIDGFTKHQKLVLLR